MKIPCRSWVRGLLAPGVLLTVLILASAAWGQTLSLMAPAIANSEGSLTARFGVTVEEKAVLKGELQDGAALVLKCDIRLDEINDYWLDSTIAATEFVSTISFDALTKEFVMTIPGRSSPLRDKDLAAILEQGWSSIEARLGAWSALERGQKYSLSVNTTMHEEGAPEGLSRFIYFWSWSKGADTTFILNFTY